MGIQVKNDLCVGKRASLFVMVTGKWILFLCRKQGKMRLTSFSYMQKNRKGKQGVRLEITGKKAKFEAGTAIGFTFLRCK